MVRMFSLDVYRKLQSNRDNIRNICLLAHVDHGKTTLADSLIAANAIISGQLVGRLRYMDSRQDEQTRGITMKSSAISLLYHYDASSYLINLIDSPGHVDFSGEVSAASRLCDGCLILVDVVEGVCPQTVAVLRQSWREGLKPILILNKIDRLIIEMKMTPEEAFRQLNVVLEQINALAGELFLSDVMENEENTPITNPQQEDEAEEKLYFSPEKGNVIFASSIDGWAFRISDFASIFSSKTGVSRDTLEKTLWGDFYLEAKTKRIRPKASEKGKQPLFVQLILEQLWSIYREILANKDSEKTLKIVNGLQIEVREKERRNQDSRSFLKFIMSQWLPLASSVLSSVCGLLPSPNQITPERMEILTNFPPTSDILKFCVEQCANSPKDPLVVFVSKMIAIDMKERNGDQKVEIRSTEELKADREALIARRNAGESKVSFGDPNCNEKIIYDSEEPIYNFEEDRQVYLGFGRVFSGCLQAGQRVFLVKSEFDEQSDTQPQVEVQIENLYLFMGRDLEKIDAVPAGNIVGIEGLGNYVFKSATLSSDPDCPPFSAPHVFSEPIVRVSIEPKFTDQLPKLIRGLKMLNQSDPCFRTFVQDTGEHVMVTSGEVHLEKCLHDLSDRFFAGNIEELVVSEPIIPFKETIVPSPKIDQLNEAIDDLNQIVFKRTEQDRSFDISISTPNNQHHFVLRAVPLPPYITELIEENEPAISELNENFQAQKSEKPTLDPANRQNFRKKTVKLFRAGLEGAETKKGQEGVF